MEAQLFLLRRPLLCFFIFSTLIVSLAPLLDAQVDDAGLKLMTDVLEWPMSMPVYGGVDDDGDFGGEEDDDEVTQIGRRSLFWRRVHYYISYGALAANRIPCPPRSGRSYYSHNCFKSRTPVNPYTRGCSRITRCRR